MGADRTTRLGSVVATAALLLLSIAIALPWGVPADWRLSLLMLPAGLVQASTLSGKAPISPLAVFGAGIVIDLVSDTPPGFWGLALLSVVLAARWTAGLVGLDGTDGALSLTRTSIAAAPAPALLLALLWGGSTLLAPGSMSVKSMWWAWLTGIAATLLLCGVISRFASAPSRSPERGLLRKA